MKLRKQKKLHNKRGFTLAETLLAVLILLLVATVVATGIPVAKNAYEKVILASNAEVLLSTTMSTLRNELDTASDITIPDGSRVGNITTGNTIRYFNSSRGTYSEIYVNDESSIKIKRVSAGSSPDPLVSSKTATQGLYVSSSTVKYDESKGIVVFGDLSVNKESGSNGIAERDTFSIRIISD